MSRFIGASILTLLVVQNSSYAQRRPSGASGTSNSTRSVMRLQLQQTIQYLRTEQTVVTKAITARYNAMISSTRLQDNEVRRMRKALQAEEVQLLNMTSDPETKTSITSQYSHMRSALGKDLRLDAAARTQLRAHKDAMLRMVRMIYSAKIQQLTLQLRQIR